GQFGLSNYNVQADWTQANITLPGTLSGSVKRLVFSWKNDSSRGTQPPINIDDISLTATPLPTGPPEAPTLASPADGATGLPKTGFNLSWTPAATGGFATYYAVYMSQDEASIFEDVYFETTATTLNPTTFAEGPSPAITFDYLDRWYWTVQAINDDGDAIVEVPFSFQIEADPTVALPHSQDFGTDATPVWPMNWTQNEGTQVWAPTASANAGGAANEMTATWTSFVGTTRLISPPLATDGVSNIAVGFNTLFDDYSAGITATLQYSHDLATWYDTSWSVVSGGGNVSGYFSALVPNAGNEPLTYVAWTLDGDHFQYDNWYVDDVAISMPPDHDVAVVSYDTITEVVPENTIVTPMATVGNNGVNIETFDVTCTIGTYTSTVTVTGLGTGATQQVSFTPLTPVLYTGETVTITSALGTDEVAANNTKTGALICLPLEGRGLANNAQTDQFVQFNLNDPTTLYPLATPYSGTYFVSGADWMNGNWMGVNYDDGTLATDEFYNINPVTGAYLPAIGEPGVALMGIAWNDTNDVMYGVGNGNLYTVDPTTGLATLGGTLWYNLEGTPTNFVDIGGLMIAAAYDNTNNILYGIDLGNDALWTINPTTWELTLVGFFGVDLNYAQDAAFDQTSGMLYLSAYSSFGGLYWVDTTSGAAYLVNVFGTSAYELDGFAIPYGLAPETPVVTISGQGTLTWDPVLGAMSYDVYSSDDPYGTYTLEASVIGTQYTGLAAAKKFYKVYAVGGRQSTNHQELRVNTLPRKTGRLGVEKRNNTGIAR
ncbi:MAG: hypothetical protein M0Q99_12115, partial [Candidatus Cloacimonetes bacterium]|nr:hypothetical protein [Candidatus Cloacimonadota bacterium]